jgi:predicted NodU family carbamoyl transferase
MMASKPIYVLGTGVSHDGSACLLKDGRVCVAIEKERVTRVKHDGGNDSAAIRYCLDAEGIAVDDLTLVVQNANFGRFERGNSYYGGSRLFKNDMEPRIVTVSHHLAHAYSALGTCPFAEPNILVVDGCGNGLDECDDVSAAELEAVEEDLRHLYFEKDSYYSYRDGRLRIVYKDFSPWGLRLKNYPMLPNTTKHSIGGVYAAVSTYCFRDNADLGKLMGLAPYGRPGLFEAEIFDLREGRVFVRYDWMRDFQRPAASHEDFKENFQYYADIAYWVQREVERALLYLVKSRYEMCPGESLAYAGGVALNAVANALILKESSFRQLHMVHAAGDNGISLGCAYYGWLEVLGKERVPHSGSPFFGYRYSEQEIRSSLESARGASLASGHQTAWNRLEWLFRLVHDCLDQRRLGGWTGALTWKIAGAGDFVTVVDADSCHFLPGKSVSSQATIAGNQANIFSLLRGNLHPARAFERQQIECTNLDALLTFYNGVDWNRVGAELRKGLSALGLLAEDELIFEQDAQIIETTARLLAQGKIVAWFQEGAEFGPRALGHRSILADPRRPEVRGRINTRIKKREEFRPFAPSVLLSDGPIYFEPAIESPYMILVANVRPEWRETLRSVVHCDGSARLQTVTSEWNERYYALLHAFKQITGVSVLLNTSLNRKGMPIVETPADALNFFRETPEIDVLVIDQYIVTRLVQALDEEIVLREPMAAH